jgi:hypothetical protein
MKFLLTMRAWITLKGAIKKLKMTLNSFTRSVDSPHIKALSKHSEKDYKGSMNNVLVEWETGETTYVPLDLIANNDPVTCAQYAKNNCFLDTPGWKRFKRYAKNQTKVERMINQTKLRSFGKSFF